MASIVKALPDCEIYGFMKGRHGLLEKEYKILTRENTSNTRRIGGTILKTVNKGRFGVKVSDGKLSLLDADLVKDTKKSYDDLGLECVCVL